MGMILGRDNDRNLPGGRKRPTSSYICRLFQIIIRLFHTPDFNFFMMKQHAVDMRSSVLDFRQAQHQIIKVAQRVFIRQPRTVLHRLSAHRKESAEIKAGHQRIRRPVRLQPGIFALSGFVDFIFVRVGDHRFGMGFKPAKHMGNASRVRACVRRVKNQNVRGRCAVSIPPHIKIRAALIVGDHLRVLCPVFCAQRLVLLCFLFPNPLVIGEGLFLNLLLIPAVSFLYQIILNCFFYL